MTSGVLEIANFVLSSITAICALYLSYAALKHTARPNVDVRMLSPTIVECDSDSLFVFEFMNVGHWYGSPMAVNVIVFCNFDPAFELKELRYGSVQSYVDSDVQVGVGRMVYLKAKGLKLGHGEFGEEVHVRAIAPKEQGRYKVRISAYSENGASLDKEFAVECRRRSELQPIEIVEPQDVKLSAASSEMSTESVKRTRIEECRMLARTVLIMTCPPDPLHG